MHAEVGAGVVYLPVHLGAAAPVEQNVAVIRARVIGRELRGPRQRAMKMPMTMPTCMCSEVSWTRGPAGRDLNAQDRWTRAWSWRDDSVWSMIRGEQRLRNYLGREVPRFASKHSTMSW